ncbi:uncharacterized protein Dvir_GJ24496 [Drosophila virilis]|uniref:Uncharacterized protein n=1 Tax=Drosophila virilis TaxID=7244 RepID=B4LYL3_DROVI|nr:uncharacterized protein Dvir_GJ24496 [Drosophila virilis]
MNVWLVLLSVFREDWFILSKYYASIHKPYNVKKYVPYKPADKPTTVDTPLTSTPLHTSTTEAAEGDHNEQTSEMGMVETSTVESTTDALTSTTEMSEMSTLLLSIIGSTPGTESTTSYDELRESSFQPYNETSYTSEAPATSLDVTSEIHFDAVSTTIPPETTTDVGDTTTQVPMLTIETPTSVEDTTYVNCLLPTTSFQQETTTESGVATTTWSEPDGTRDEANTRAQLLGSTTQPTPTTSSEPDTTTDGADTTTQLLITTQSSSAITSEPETTTDTTTELLTSVTQTTTTSSAEPDTTTDVADATTQSTQTTSSEPETTTGMADTTTQITIFTTRTALLESGTTEIPFGPSSTIAFESTTEADAVVEVNTDETMARTSSGDAILVDDIIQAKPRKLTYSSDVMPEMEWY